MYIARRQELRTQRTIAYTISRAILADAIALTRGDRFFTADYTPHNMTAWGFADCQRVPSAPGYGSTLGRLLLRTLPNHYAPDSTYTWFPLMTPKAMGRILTNLGDSALYDMGKPAPTMDVPEVRTYSDAAQVLGGKFNVPYAGRAAHVIKGDGCVLALCVTVAGFDVCSAVSLSRRTTPRGASASSGPCSMR